MKATNQIMREEARRLFDYRDGTLYWRHAASGRRKDRRAVTERKLPQSYLNKFYVRIGGAEYKAHYLVWNWHHGITVNVIEFVNEVEGGICIENLREIIPAIQLPQSYLNKYNCPCCAQRVPQPTVDVIAHAVNLPPQQEAVLRAVWAGKGRPVQAEAVFAEMYADDPDGGPSPSRMYAAFKVALCHLRENLKGTGISVDNVGYRQGYRLVMKEAKELNGGLSQQGDDHRERGEGPRVP